VQYAGVAALTGPQDSATSMMNELRIRRDTAVDGLRSIHGVSVACPESTFYLFPDVTQTMDAMGIDDVGVFAEQALHNTGMSFCTRRHFGRSQAWEDRDYIRLAYSGLNAPEIAEGLAGLQKWVDSKIAKVGAK
jgi:aspartate aminotransferase